MINTPPQIDQCPAGMDWGLSKESLSQIRKNFREWLKRNGGIEEQFSRQVLGNRGVALRSKPAKVVRKLTEAPGMTVADVASKIGIAPQTVSKHIAKGLLRAKKHGHRTVRVDLADFHAYRRRLAK